MARLHAEFRKMATRSSVYLWEFLLEVLEDQELDLFCYWIDKPRREFCVKDPEEIAKLWGIMKQRPFMDKKKLLRAIRYYYNSELITKIPGATRGSLFAGMNLGGIKRVSSKTSACNTGELKEQVKASATSSKESIDSKTKSHGSKFSFITKTKGLHEDREREDTSSTDNSCSVIDLFDTLNEVNSSTGENQLSLSYSDQLAEILPGLTPLDQGLLPSNSGGGIYSDSSDDLPEYKIASDVTDVRSTDVDDTDPVKSEFPNDTDSSEELDKNVDPVKLELDFPEDTDSSSDVDENIDVVKISNPPEDTNSGDELHDADVLDSDEGELDVKDQNIADIVKYNLHLDPEESLSLFYSLHSFKRNKLRDERQELQTNICTAYEDMKSKMLSLQGQLSNLRTKFDEALTNDDYDLAAEINEQIEELNTEKIQLGLSRSRLLNEKVNEFFTSFGALKNHEMDFHKWALENYEEFHKQQGELLEKHKQQSSHDVESRKQELTHEKDQVNRSLQHLQLDKEHLEKDRRDLDERINSKLEVFKIRKKELSLKQNELESEIEQLEKRLNELRSEKEKVVCFIKDEDEKMMAVRKEFESVETKLNDAWSKIKNEEEMLDKKLEDISTNENKLDLIISAEQQKEECLVKNMSYLSVNKEKSEAFIKTTQTEVAKDKSQLFLTCLTQDHCDNLIKLRSLEKAKAKDLQDFELKVFSKEQAVSTKTKRWEEIKDQIPELERTKKCAVTAHNFKEAKRVNEIMKQLADEIETVSKDLGDMQNTLSKDKEKTKLLKQEYDSVKSNVVKAKEYYDLTVVEQLVNKLKKIFEMDTSVDQDDLINTLKKEEIDLVKVEFSSLEDIREHVLSRLSENENDRELLHFLKELTEEKTDAPTGD